MDTPQGTLRSRDGKREKEEEEEEERRSTTPMSLPQSAHTSANKPNTGVL